MNAIPTGTILRYIRDVVAVEDHCLTDAEALRRFATDRDERAFATLLRRHAQVVWAVCRHLLHHDQDAEDAFQATFLLLAQKPGSIRKGEAVGCWLHGVAYRVAVRARQTARRRQACEREAPRPDRRGPPPEAAWRELQAALDAEVHGLPEKYRAPFVLCCLGCKTREEAAHELGCPEGTVSSRIARARDLLQRRLARRGVSLSAVLCAGVVWRQAVAAAVPPALVGTTLAVAGSGEVVSAGARTLAAAALRTAASGRLLLFVALLSGFGLLAALAVAPPPAPDRSAKALAPAARERTDLFGDPLPPGALTRMGTIRFAHQEWMHGPPVLAPDNKTFATVSCHPYPRPGIVSLWDATTGKELRRLEDPDFEHYQVFFVRSENLLGTIGISRQRAPGRKDRHAMHFWDPKTGKKAPGGIQVEGYHFEPWALSPDERTITCASREPPVLVRDRKTGKFGFRTFSNGINPG